MLPSADEPWTDYIPLLWQALGETLYMVVLAALLTFVLGLLISNFVIVVLSSVSFVSSQTREWLYVSIGAVAGLFSLFVGTIFLFGLDTVLPDLGAVLPF